MQKFKYKNFFHAKFRKHQNFDSSTRSTEQFEIESKRDGLALNLQRSVWILLLDKRSSRPGVDRESKLMISSSECGQRLPPL